MKKKDEAALRNSCWNKAHDDELVFVLLERDEAAPAAIREWIRQRIALGKNTPDQPQIVEAMLLADTMEARRG